MLGLSPCLRVGYCLELRAGLLIAFDVLSFRGSFFCFLIWRRWFLIARSRTVSRAVRAGKAYVAVDAADRDWRAAAADAG